MGKLKVMTEVQRERDRQDKKWGEHNHKPLFWLAILGEEVGEANKAVVDNYYKVAKQGRIISSYWQYRSELIQVAAVAIAAIESLDRNLWCKDTYE